MAAIKKEVDRLNNLKKQSEKLVEVLKENIKTSMINLGKEEVKFDTVKINFKKSSSVVIVDENNLPECCYETIKSVKSKTELKELIEQKLINNNSVIIQENKNLQIK